VDGRNGPKGRIPQTQYSPFIRRDRIGAEMDEGRKRVIRIMAALLTAIHMQRADDLLGTPQGSPRTEKLIAASVQWAEKIMEKIDERFSRREDPQ